MDKTIHITVLNKIAVKTCDTVYVCGNSDFTVRFTFDEDWTEHYTKTARFIANDGTYVDQPFSGDACPVPILKNTYGFNVGVYAGSLETTTPAYCPAKKSILCPGGLPKDPEPDVYNAIMKKLNDGSLKGTPGDAGATYTPTVDESGILSWSNDKNLENPAPVDLTGPQGQPGKDADIFTVRIGGGNVADKTFAEIMEAYSANKTCICTGADRRVFLLHSYNVDDGGPHFLFIAPTEYKTESGLAYMRIKIYQNGNVLVNATTARTPNVKRLIFTDENGQKLYEYDGTQEVKVPNNGGSGGSNLPETTDPHMMLVTDADGKTAWEERTHYAEAAEVVFMPYQEFQLTDGEATILNRVLDYDLEIGKSYTVRYNGVDYECITEKLPLEEIKGIMFGNTTLITDNPDTTKEPFIMVLINNLDTDGLYGMILTIDGSSVANVGITGKYYTYKPLDENYLPDNIRNQAKKINIQLRDNMSGIADMSFKEAWEMDESQLQSAINVYSYDGKEKYSVFGVGKLVNDNYYDFIQFSIQIPSDVGGVITHVFVWGGEIGEDVGEITKEIQHRHKYDSLPTFQPTGARGLNAVAVNEFGDYHIYQAEYFFQHFRSRQMYLNSKTTYSDKFYEFTIDDDRNIILAENDGTSTDVVDTIIKKSDLYALVDGDGISIDEKNNTLNLNTMSPTVKGGAKVGKGLKMDGEVLGVEPEGKYELIEEIINGYKLLTERPKDWDTNYTAYFKREIDRYDESTFSQLTDETIPEWEGGLYYASEDIVSVIVRTKLDLKCIWLEFEVPIATKANAAGVAFYTNPNENGTIYIASAVKTTEKSFFHIFASFKNGNLTGYATSPIKGKTQQSNNLIPFNFRAHYKSGESFYAVRVGTGADYPAGTIIKIRGVRA